MSFQPEPNQSCSDVLQAADADRRDGRFYESLQKFEWFFENSRYERGMGGVRLSFALSYWMELATIYEPAMKAFLALRDRTADRCRESVGDFNAFHEFSALNRYLGDDERTVSLFLDIARANHDAAAGIYHVAEPLLVSRGLYKECGPFLEIDRTVETNISAWTIGRKHEESFTGRNDCPPLLADRMFRERTCRLVALLALNDRLPDAKAVVVKALENLDITDFRSDLESAMIGHFPES